jgi:hypothetical protein
MAITQSERILDLALSGWSVNEISKVLEVSRATVTAELASLASVPSANKSAVGGPEATSLATLLGNLRQTGFTARPARSNVSSLSVCTDGALAATGIGCFVPVAVEIGDVISAVNILVGNTAGGTMTHQFGAIYAGTGAEPALIEQSTDTTSAAIAKEALATWSLAVPKTITEAMAPHGFIYAEVAITATTVPTAMVYGTPAAINYKVGTNGPLFFSFTAGSALAGTAAATTGSPTVKVVAPVVILT